MRKELLVGIALSAVTVGLSTTAFSRATKTAAKEARTDITDKSKLETHHRDPYYRSNDDDPQNAIALTRPEHAYAHLTLAREAPTRTDRQANQWAVRKIIQRMSPEELTEFNQMIQPRKKR